MNTNLHIYNTLTRKKEKFEPIKPPFVGMYVCGPTVYGTAHLGHARAAITFDILYRYLMHIGYKVRYVRNITDVGHLENDADTGEDKIAKKARVEQLEPMEVAQYYTNNYHKNMRALNLLEPSIEPKASGHIIEQMEIIQKILANGYAYEVNGSVYFDVEKYNEKHHYGKLSGRVLEDLRENTRDLDGQSDKRNSFDFALWKKAEPTHIMRWSSQWSDGFPGWHLECSAMGTKYLGEEFDIHGGGLDLQFPHHECEIAQNMAALGKNSVKYWMHNNLITLNGKKMGKSLGNAVSLDEFFSGDHKLLEQAYNPMVIRFFILQAHYRSTLDFSNKALQAAEKGLEKLLNAFKTLKNIKPAKSSTIDINEIKNKCYEALNDDLNTPVLIAHLFDGIKTINQLQTEKESISKDNLAELTSFYNDIITNVLGILPQDKNNSDAVLNQLSDFVLKLRSQAKTNKDYATADQIRDELTKLGYIIKDTKEGVSWELK